VREALRNVREMEDDYGRRIGSEQACRALRDLLDALDPEVTARSTPEMRRAAKAGVEAPPTLDLAVGKVIPASARS
jgi:hypothetical protein